MSEKKKKTLRILGILIFMLILIIAFLQYWNNMNIEDEKNKARNVITDKENNDVEKEEPKEEENKNPYAAPKEEYNIVTATEDPRVDVLIINGNTVNFESSYYELSVNEVLKISDYYLVEISTKVTSEDDLNETILYAISSSGEVLWFIRNEDICRKENNNKCLRIHGVFTIDSSYGYDEKYYKIDGNKLSFLAEDSSQDSIYSACEYRNKYNDFIVEYEIEYLGENNFSTLNKKSSVSARDYLKSLAENGTEVSCSY